MKPRLVSIMKVSRLAGLACVALVLATSSCQFATSNNDLPLEEWVVTSVYVKYKDSTKTAYSTYASITYADSSDGSGSNFTDDYDGTKGVDVSTLYSISSGTISSFDMQAFILSTAPDPSTRPVVSFDTSHYFYRRGNGYSVGQALAKCHFKTASITVTFQQ